MTTFKPLDWSGLQTVSLKDRPSKVVREDFGRPWQAGGALSEFFERLPNILAASDFRKIADRWSDCIRKKRTIMLGMGGHPVKVGLSPIIIDLVKRGAIGLLAVNGSVMVHDTETAMVGTTSEDVAAALGQGAFGTTRESNELINAAAARAAREGSGLGRTLGRMILENNLPFAHDSIFAQAAALDIPMTVHVALGTDVYHIHPQVDGAALGRASMDDFRTFASAVAALDGGLFINLGSAVIMPEIFLKAVTLVRNLGHQLDDITTVNMDFIKQYRPLTNIVSRPTAKGGAGYNLVGHHEIMFPLLAAAVIEAVGV